MTVLISLVGYAEFWFVFMFERYVRVEPEFARTIAPDSPVMKMSVEIDREVPEGVEPEVVLRSVIQTGIERGAIDGTARAILEKISL